MDKICTNTLHNASANTKFIKKVHEDCNVQWDSFWDMRCIAHNRNLATRLAALHEKISEALNKLRYLAHWVNKSSTRTRRSRQLRKQH